FEAFLGDKRLKKLSRLLVYIVSGCKLLSSSGNTRLSDILLLAFAIYTVNSDDLSFSRSVSIHEEWHAILQ
ncbi:31932_t:CDS:1, partial [Racocetra persica]